VPARFAETKEGTPIEAGMHRPVTSGNMSTQGNYNLSPEEQLWLDNELHGKRKRKGCRTMTSGQKLGII
jgi:hypothetical protein